MSGLEFMHSRSTWGYYSANIILGKLDLGYLVKMGPTPFRRVLAGMPVENSKEALSTNATEISDKRMGILHRPPRADVLRDAYLIEGTFCWVAVEDLN
jgi:hypothetical protein